MLAVPHVVAPVLLPVPLFLQQLLHYYLKILTTHAVNSTHVQLFVSFRFSFFFQAENYTGRNLSGPIIFPIAFFRIHQVHHHLL